MGLIFELVFQVGLSAVGRFLVPLLSLGRGRAGAFNGAHRISDTAAMFGGLVLVAIVALIAYLSMR
ncbi:hypothetical protein ASF61_16190 [Duganella sp. Leaf126]|uniref:hypothetical protein n=1 Tax=Duganella sp. Leaf126 TaxID=1736266 RepID=UPI0006FF86C3|nr:hypothetical protein [Duganella sp. Leaf126]KQQ31889.1 hypothetical protein ASF61_16190 [Duganella sp. Leaf126]